MVMVRAISESERYREPCHSKPSASAVTVWVLSCQTRIIFVPGLIRPADGGRTTAPNRAASATWRRYLRVAGLSPPAASAWIHQAIEKIKILRRNVMVPGCRVIVRLDRRNLVWINVTANPTAE